MAARTGAPGPEWTPERIRALGLAAIAQLSENTAMSGRFEDDAACVEALLRAADAWAYAEQAARAAGLTHAAEEAADHGSRMVEAAAEHAMLVWSLPDEAQHARIAALGLTRP